MNENWREKNEKPGWTPLRPTTADKETTLKEQRLSSQILGYNNPHIADYIAVAQKIYKNINIPDSEGYSGLNENEAEAILQSIKENVAGGVMIDCGYGPGRSPNISVAHKLDIKNVVGIEIQAKSIGNIGEYKEKHYAVSETETARILRIREDITVAIAQMRSQSIDVVYYKALDVFRGNIKFFFEEIMRALKPGGYIIDDGESRLHQFTDWEQFVPKLEEIYYSFSTTIFRKID